MAAPGGFVQKQDYEAQLDQRWTLRSHFGLFEEQVWLQRVRRAQQKSTFFRAFCP